MSSEKTCEDNCDILPLVRYKWAPGPSVLKMWKSDFVVYMPVEPNEADSEEAALVLEAVAETEFEALVVVQAMERACVLC